jgi:hypothetical protein
LIAFLSTLVVTAKAESNHRKLLEAQIAINAAERVQQQKLAAARQAEEEARLQLEKQAAEEEARLELEREAAAVVAAEEERIALEMQKARQAEAAGK